jgi:putative pyruvate formate lyase activating enzyme
MMFKKNNMISFQKRIQQGVRLLQSCTICPRACKVNRLKGEWGYCHTGRKIQISSFAVHHGEEPPLSGIKGAGNIFITGCNLSCVFCQNYPISQMHHGKEYTSKEVVEKLLYLQNKQKVHNIIFVTPSHVIPQIIEIIQEAKKKGLHIPIGYNSSGYDSVSSLKLLEGIIDIYLPDFKYSDETLAKKYSHAPGYKNIATKAIQEMIRQVGPLKIGRDGIAKKGVLIRHLVLPSHEKESVRVLQHIAKQFTTKIPVSVMNQYFPAYKVIAEKKFSALNRNVTEKEYENVLKVFHRLGLEGYYQKKEEC